jgi:uncharacterized membrane protein YqjE
LGEEMPKKKEKTPDILTIVIFIILAIVILKILRIIPDPPEYDINIVISLLALATAILTAFSNWLSKRFSSINDAIDNLTKNIQTLSTDMKLLEQKINHIESDLNFHERLVRLEEKKK